MGPYKKLLIECNLPLFIVDTSEISVYNRMVRVDGQCTQVSCNGAIEYSSFLQHISKVDVRVEEVWIYLDSLNQETYYMNFFEDF